MISKTKKSIASAGGLLNDSVKFLFQDRPKANLTKFIDEINSENAEHMSYQKDFDESFELCPTYEQLNQDRINDQAAKNVMMLKSFEHILDERSQAFSGFLDNLIKARSSFDAFQGCDGTLRQALDALFVFVEQELQQARQQLSLGDLKRFVADVKADALTRVADYQREIVNAETDVATAEKALIKTKEGLQRLHAKRAEASGELPSMVGKMSSYRFGPSSPPPSSPVASASFVAPSEDRSEKSKETDELIARQEREVREHVKELLAALANRDQVLAASRRAFQKLNRECKMAISTTLRKIVDREREALAARQMVVDKLQAAVESLDELSDETDFIREYCDDDPQGGLVLCSQALSILGDVNILERQNQELLHGSVDSAPMPSPPRYPMEEGGPTSANKSSSKAKAAERQVAPPPKVVLSMEETTMHLSKIFFLAEWPEGLKADATPAELLDILLTKPLESTDDSSSSCSSTAIAEYSRRDSPPVELREAVERLSAMKMSLEGRRLLVNVLNQFRSKKVDVGIGFPLLGAVLWSLLSECRIANDVHNGKIVMILSQTFYRNVHDENAHIDDTVPDEDKHADESCRDRRQYLKEILICHPIWAEGRFWEQALWQCVLEQLQMIQYGVAWHDLPIATERMEAVHRVHDVIFSQVMAIAHSMIELGCSQTSAREFVFRMCVIHQLSEKQRQQLLTHLSSHERVH